LLHCQAVPVSWLVPVLQLLDAIDVGAFYLFLKAATRPAD
jgi:hypothetical protein